MVILLFSLLAGALSTLSPCVLPIVPIVVSSAMQTARFGPIALMSGVALSYTLVGTALALFGSKLGVDAGQLRSVSAVLMLFFGLVFLAPPLQRGLTRVLSPLTSGANAKVSTFSADSTWGQGVLGLMLGVVWSPCVGPTLGSAVTMAANEHSALRAFTTMLAFGVGAALPMGLLAYGSRATVGRSRNAMAALGLWGKRVMGVGLVLIASLVLTGADRWLETLLTRYMPAWLLDVTTRF